jgi:hypothetical protein
MERTEMPKTPKPANNGGDAPEVLALVTIIETCLDHRKEKPSLAVVAKISSRASSLLKIPKSERVAVENSAALAVCRKLDVLPL